MGLSPEILKNLYLKKIKSPMPIQKYVIPLVLKNQHCMFKFIKSNDILIFLIFSDPIIGNAETGSGKTIGNLN